MNEESDWRDEMQEIYRQTRLELQVWKNTADNNLEYWINELEEALLDLKQATIARDQSRATSHSQEIILLLIEIRHRNLGD